MSCLAVIVMGLDSRAKIIIKFCTQLNRVNILRNEQSSMDIIVPCFTSYISMTASPVDEFGSCEIYEYNVNQK